MNTVCLSCYALGHKIARFGSSYHKICPKCGKPVTEIDELITPTIIELNRKGYKTLYCCSGHLSSFNSFYIYFDGKMPEQIPPYLKKDKNANIIRGKIEKDKDWKGIQNIIAFNRKVYKWATLLTEVKS